MPRATLTYQLPEEAEEYACANAAGTMASALGEIRRIIRDWRKYNVNTPAEVIQLIHDEVAEGLGWEEMR
jgi:hypothetical protein